MWLAQQIVEAFPWDTAPRYLIRDNDGAYGQAFTNRVRTMGIRDRPISPRSPWQNAYVERLIGTLRRDCLDHILIVGERHLRRVLTSYSLYYNETRTHLGLSKDAPLGRAVQRSGTIVTRGYNFREGQGTAYFMLKPPTEGELEGFRFSAETRARLEGSGIPRTR